MGDDDRSTTASGGHTTAAWPPASEDRAWPGWRAAWALFRVQWKQGVLFSPSAFTSRPTARLGAGEWASFALLMVAVVPLLGLVTAFSLQIYRGLAIVGQPEVLLTLFFVPALLVAFILGLAALFSGFFFSRDINLLAALPLSPGTIVGGKLATVLAQEWLGSLLLAPPLAIYGVGEGAGPAYWVMAVAVYLLLPIPAVALAALVAMGLMGVAGRTRHRDWMVVAGSLAAAFLALAAQLLTHSAGSAADPARLGAQLPELAALIARYAPPALWATRALAGDTPGEAIGGLAMLAGTAAVSLAGVGLVARRLFFRALAASQASPAGAGRTRRARLAAPLGARPVFRTLVWREGAVLWRTPVFAMNTLLPLVLVPAMLALTWWMGRNDAVQELQALFSNPVADPWSVVTGVAITASTGVLASLGATAVSREGRSVWISRIIPVSPAEQASAKLAFASAVTWVAGLPLGAAVGWFFGWSPLLWIYWLVVGAGGVVAVNGLQLLVDLVLPKLDWTDPQGAVKQNFNVMWGLLIGLVTFGSGAVLFGLVARAGLVAALAVLGTYIVGLAIIATWLVRTLAERTYPSMNPPSG